MADNTSSIDILQAINNLSVYNITKNLIQIPILDILIYEDLFYINNNYVIITLQETDEKVVPDIGDILFFYLDPNRFYSPFGEIEKNIKTETINNTDIKYLLIHLIVEDIEYEVDKSSGVKEGCKIKLSYACDFRYPNRQFSLSRSTKFNNVIEELNKQYNIELVVLDTYNNINISPVTIRQTDNLKYTIEHINCYETINNTDFRYCPIYSIFGFIWISLYNLISVSTKDLKSYIEENKIIKIDDEYLVSENIIKKKLYVKNMEFENKLSSIDKNDDTISIKLLEKENENLFNICHISTYGLTNRYLYQVIQDRLLSNTLTLKIEGEDKYNLRVGTKVILKNKIYLVISSITKITTTGYFTTKSVLSYLEKYENNV